jgi:hypothetical protein
VIVNLEESLNEFLDQDLLTEEQQGFIIDNDEKADWAIRKVLRLQQKNNDIKQLAELQINKIKQWQERESEGNDSSINYLTALLAPYAKSQLDGKKKTVKMPSGNVSFRSVSPGYFIAGNKVDGKNQRLIDHVKKSDPEYLKIEESVNWSEFKDTLTPLSTGKVLTNDGEVLDFISAVEYPDSISIKERK